MSDSVIEADPRPPAATEGTASLLRLQTRLAEVYRDRCHAALSTWLDAMGEAGGTWLDHARPTMPVQAAGDAVTYWTDFAQRSLLFWDTLRRRGNDWLAHEAAGKPPLLAFPYEIVVDARRFERPANYALARIVPPADTPIDEE